MLYHARKEALDFVSWHKRRVVVIEDFTERLGWARKRGLLINRRSLVKGSAAFGAALAAGLPMEAAFADTPFSTYSYPVTGGTTSRTTPTRLGDLGNALDYGMVGDGSTDNSGPMQTFVNNWGTSETNKGLFFPPGIYNFHTPVLTPQAGVSGWALVGSGSFNTAFSYVGSLTAGNSYTGLGTGSATMTPLFGFCGAAYGLIKDISFAMGDASAFHNTACIWETYNGTHTQTQVRFEGVNTSNAKYGFAIGLYSTNACSENQFIGCNGSTPMDTAFAFEGSNVLNNVLMGCGAAQCATGVQITQGNAFILDMSLNGQTTVDIECNTGQNCGIYGTRTESNNFVDCINAGGTSTIIEQGITSSSASGYYVQLETGVKVVIISGQQSPSTSGFGIIQNPNPSTGDVWDLGSVWQNTGYSTSYLANGGRLHTL